MRQPTSTWTNEHQCLNHVWDVTCRKPLCLMLVGWQKVKLMRYNSWDIWRQGNIKDVELYSMVGVQGVTMQKLRSERLLNIGKSQNSLKSRVCTVTTVTRLLALQGQEQIPTMSASFQYPKKPVPIPFASAGRKNDASTSWISLCKSASSSSTADLRPHLMHQQ